VFAQGRYYSRNDLDAMLAGGRQTALNLSQPVH
jgi:hypothetical protein